MIHQAPPAVRSSGIRVPRGWTVGDLTPDPTPYYPHRPRHEARAAGMNGVRKLLWSDVFTIRARYAASTGRLCDFLGDELARLAADGVSVSETTIRAITTKESWAEPRAPKPPLCANGFAVLPNLVTLDCRQMPARPGQREPYAKTGRPRGRYA